jgi:nucleoside-diphosphate-sugar epimerase
MQKTVLILGASGRFGRNAQIAFHDAGWDVRLFRRGVDTLWDAAWGADVIVNAWNPAYTDWAWDVPKQTKEVIDVAEASGALVIVPGNVYPFGVDAPSAFGPLVPHGAKNLLGRIRSDMESAYQRSNARTLILRAGDFLDTEASGNWFDKIMIQNLSKGTLTYPGAVDVPHAWAFLPDMARAAVGLAENADHLPRFADVPFPGYTLTGVQMAEHLTAVMGKNLRVKPMSWLPIRLISPFWEMGRRLLEMRYLWSKPHHLVSDPFDALLPGFQPTPVSTALRLAIQHKVNPDQPMPRGSLYVGKTRAI